MLHHIQGLGLADLVGMSSKGVSYDKDGHSGNGLKGNSRLKQSEQGCLAPTGLFAGVLVGGDKLPCS